MPDVPGDLSTTATIAVGGTIPETIDGAGDRDWFRLDLAHGQEITVALNGITLEDAYLRIRDPSGNVIYENDDSGPGLSALKSFMADATGTYYIEVGAWNDAGSGTYQLSVTPYVLPPVATPEQIADQLINGYWDGDHHHFDVGPGGAITVDLTALTAQGRNLATWALQTWTDIIGVQFVPVTSGAQIVFGSDEAGAFTEGVWSNGIITSEHVNVAQNWVDQLGYISGYGFQAFIHEIGHALGLGHAGNYNFEADYPWDASFRNDSWDLSVMSYFSADDNTFVRSHGWAGGNLVTPMVADIIAITQLYGVSTTTRPGDTTYGFNSTADRSWFDVTQFRNVVYTIYDSAGVDTLDYSGFLSDQRIDLTPGSYSDVSSSRDNVAIAPGVIIENVIAGYGWDNVTGNAADNVLTGNGGIDTLTGGAGADTFKDTAAGLNGDLIVDFSPNDRIWITDANLTGFTFSITGNTLSYTGGSLRLGVVPTGTVVAAAAAGGGVQLTLSALPPHDPNNDFNGDGRSDILWRNDNGALTDWLGTGTGGFAPNGSTLLTVVDTGWQIAGTGDFNGDGKDDVLWRRADGALTDWLGSAGGGLTPNGANLLTVVDNQWQVAGVGDFNGDGKDDVLWHRGDGAITDWLGTASGGLGPNAGSFLDVVNTQWQIAGVGDFNGDGKDDLLWRSADGRITNWLGTASGAFSDNASNGLNGVSLDWQIAGIGDFNGDGRDDILWRNTDGRITDWLGTASGGCAPNSGNFYTSLGTDWSVGSIGDFNGDTRDDILFRNSDGRMTDWLGTATGSFTDNLPNAYQAVDAHWHTQPHSSLV